MERIILFGGHGKIALLAETLLAEQRIAVTAVIRNPEQADAVRATGADPLVADIETLESDELAALIAGHDAVVWSAGAGGGNPERTRAVDELAAVRSMAAAEQAGVRRYVMVSYFGASHAHGIDPSNPFFAYAEAKAAADTALRGSALDWTILGPSSLTSDPGTGGIDVLAEAGTHVARQTVAEVIVATLLTDSTVRQTIRFNDGATPIADALTR